MCGIFGAYGNTSTQAALNALERLEYRGYDSAGIAYLDKDIEIIKSVGKIDELRMVTPIKSTSMVIGHTRWATNGTVNINNCHPHMSSDNQIVVVHNGILENESELISTYFSDYKRKSDTDSETIANLLSLFILKDGSILKAMEHLMEIMKGSYAILIMVRGKQGIYFMKNNSPLVLAVDDKKSFYLVSDIYALPNNTISYGHITDKSFGFIADDYYCNNYISFFAYDFKLDFSKHEDNMLREIKEELEASNRISMMIEEYCKRTRSYFTNSRQIIYLGAGSSYYAGLYLARLTEDILGIKSEAILSSEFTYSNLYKDSLFVFISQSGETADLILLEKDIKSDKKILITNNEKSTLASKGMLVLDILAGKEVAVAATKSFNQTVLLGYLLFCRIMGVDAHDYNNYQKNLAYFINEYKYDKFHIEKYKKVFYLGKGYDYIAALEGSLKLKEISYISTWGVSSNELKHGSLALVDEETLTIGLSSSLESYMLHSLNEVKARNGGIAYVAVPYYCKYLGGLCLVTFTQLASYYTAIKKGLNADRPRNLAKSVTVI